MPACSNLIYTYDGSFEGLMCCVFESYARKEIPADIICQGNRTMLMPVRQIITDKQKAKRVLASIPIKIGKAALVFVKQAFLTCLPQKELNILLFLRLGYCHGPSVLNMLTDEVVYKLFKAVKHLKRESHLFKGFVRFSVVNNTLVAEIEPKNYVLPLLRRHFCERYREERFLIYDKTHGHALVYQPYRFMIIPIDNLQIPEADKKEQIFRQLWRLFYQNVEVPGRHNPQCRRSLMPQRYWTCMTEFTPHNKVLPKPEDSEFKNLANQNIPERLL